MLIDTHSHLNFGAYKNDLEKVIERSLANNIWVINVGSKYETSEQAVEIAKRYKQEVYAAIGLHPISIKTDLMKLKTDPNEGNFVVSGEDFDKSKYKKLFSEAQGKVVAIGEIGLDYYYRPKTKTKQEQFKRRQKEVFLEQLELAKELNLPVILHCRMAHEEMIEILKSEIQSSNVKSSSKSKVQIRGVIHCFTGTLEEAKKYVEMGFYIGFTGIIFKFDLEEMIKEIPLEKILIETDCPYLTPPLARRSSESEGGRNEPIFVKYVLQRIADIKNIDIEKAAEITTKNARELFKI